MKWKTALKPSVFHFTRIVAKCSVVLSTMISGVELTILSLTRVTHLFDRSYN